ncbi:MAG: proteasome-activating nucleotidase, partial [Methanospirillum sp.]|nr:proteasome-activating nucleotidase [Methanospirillum sp.]
MSETGRQSDDPKTPEELYRYLVERVAGMESQNQELKEQIRQLESDKRYIETQKIRYEREVRKLKSEIEHLKTPPLIVGTITDVIDSGRVVVRS